ncbi:phosphatase PAP2 family protein [Natrialbaceae archaeon GCM10025810]|uniref:phosphatase PAP2 family protein n=1 Tax=Halovalidus salilacus TaxID=3075124 RepID=UPI003607402D
MPLLIVATVTALVALAGLAVTCTVCIDREQLRDAPDVLDTRFFDVGPYLCAAGLFFFLKRLTHEESVRLSKSIGWDITARIYDLEGLFVAGLQDVLPGVLYPVLSAFYMFGFPYLLVAAPVLYFLTPTLGSLKELLVAYLLNYVVGSICYTLFIAYGPRVHVSEHVDGMMYDLYPETQELTSAVSSNTDVFPSLHTSLSVVVLLFAWQTRREQPRWFTVASVVTASVVLSTMALGIHWLTDVVAGVLLAVGSVVVARRLVSTVDGEPTPPSESIEGAPNEQPSIRSDD